MKKACALMICLSLLVAATAQQPLKLQPLYLTVSTHKTTNIVFPYPIKSVDKGTRDVLAQKARGAENVLQIKAAKENFTETNLSVITGEGKLYSFILNYATNPAELIIYFDKSIKDSLTRVEFPDSIHLSELQQNAEWVAIQPAMWHRRQDRRFGVTLNLTGLYIRDDVFYYQLIIANRTNINYDVDQLRFFIKDRSQSKRTASQELPQEPILLLGNTTKIEANSSQTIVAALPKFTIPNKKELIIQLMERNGGRHLQLELGNQLIIRAKTIL